MPLVDLTRNRKQEGPAGLVVVLGEAAIKDGLASPKEEAPEDGGPRGFLRSFWGTGDGGSPPLPSHMHQDCYNNPC